MQNGRDFKIPPVYFLKQLFLAGASRCAGASGARAPRGPTSVPAELPYFVVGTRASRTCGACIPLRGSYRTSAGGALA